MCGSANVAKGGLGFADTYSITLRCVAHFICNVAYLVVGLRCGVYRETRDLVKVQILTRGEGFRLSWCNHSKALYVLFDKDL